MTDNRKNFPECAGAELSDAEAAQASGGNWSWADKQYKSGDTPKFSVGDRVHASYVYEYEGYITAVSTKKSGIVNKEFTYTVLWEKFTKDSKSPWTDCHKTETNVYESQLKLL